MKKLILDACCGMREFWFNKKHPNTIYMDIRTEEKGFCKLRPNADLVPDIVADFRNMPFPDNSFKLIIFDPPHLSNLVETSQFRHLYGQLNKKTWREDIKKGFDECLRVLEDYGTLIFKWSATDIKRKELLEVIVQEPLFGHKTIKNTIWFTFMKIPK